MTNRPSEILSAVDPGAQNEYKNALHTILDSHAARLESLERDREAVRTLVRVACLHMLGQITTEQACDAARAFLADSPPLSPEAKSSSRGVRFTKIVNSDIDIVVYAYDEDGKCWFCPRDGNIVLSVVQERHTDEIDIPRSEAVALRPAIATRWPDTSPQSEWPSEKSERETLQLIDERDAAEQALLQAYFIVMGRSPEWSNLFGYKEALVDIEDAVSVLKQAAKTELTRPSPPAQSEQPGKHEGGEAMEFVREWLKKNDVGGHEWYDDEVAEVAKQYAASRDSRIAQLEAELVKCRACNERALEALRYNSPVSAMVELNKEAPR